MSTTPPLDNGIALQEDDHYDSQQEDDVGMRAGALDAESQNLLPGAATHEIRHDEDHDERFDTKERWNSPPINKYRYVAVNVSLFILGMHDGCIGALLPFIEKYYDINYAIVSTMFLAPFLGYVTAALSNNWVHYKVGQRGVAFLGPTFRLIGYIPLALHPPFAVIPILFMLVGFGNGIEDSAYNAWVGNMQHTNELLGIIHGAFGLGGTVAPLVASALVAKLEYPWYTFYYLMIAAVCFEFVFGLWAFWGATGAAYREKLRQEDSSNSEGVTTRIVLGEPIVWLAAIFLLAYAGVEVSLGGWIPTFMIEVRKADPFLAGVTATLFWFGLSLGRIVLGFITGKIGEKMAITAYLLFCVVLELLYWFIPSMVGAMIFVGLLGFFLGPLFPATIVVMTKLLPQAYHISAIGFASALGGGGATVLPFAVGAIAQGHGVQVLQPIVLTSLIFLVYIWLSIPRSRKSGVTQGGKYSLGGLLSGIFGQQRAPQAAG
ncbi:MFS transporter [Purpureocillium lavendulum]|uniref:MFS transporter n=1 Tax=Purpureocillium lavendulum TaxID=1247861 RepID=A0AB34FP12_9HYPO|nr:MFS transporter [Purpureocillium lavendulum]